MRRSKSKRIFIYMAVVALLVFLYVIGVLRPFENITTGVLNPLFSGMYSFGSEIRVKYNEQTDKRDLQEEVKKLEEKVAVLTEKNLKYKTTEEENRILRGHLRFLEENKYNYVMSNVISRGDIINPTSRTESIVIDKGTNDGLVNGLAVLSNNGVIVGKIVEVGDSISKVLLTNNPNCQLAATILGEEKTSGITYGDLGLTIKMDFIPQSRIIKENDIVITSGLEESIPRGLIIGNVVTINKESNEIWQNAIIEQTFNTEDLIIVSVLIP